MKILLNDKAEDHFNKKAIDFLYELKPDNTQKQKVDICESSSSHVFVSGHFTENNIIDISSMAQVDQISGKDVSRYFLADKIPIGLDEVVYAKFELLIEDIHRNKDVNPFVSKSFLLDCGFKWFEKRYKGEISGDVDLIGFVKDQAEISIKVHTISLPISFLSIENPFTIGSVRFDYLKTDFCDDYVDRIKNNIIEQGKLGVSNFDMFENRFRQRYQGTVFASITLEAEQQRCIEIAKMQAEKALMVLRFFSPSTFIPEIPCYFGFMGKTDIHKNYYFIYSNDAEMPSIHENIDDKRTHTWTISSNELLELHKNGLGAAANIVFNDNPTEFADIITNSMFLFGRAITSMEFQDKMVYSLVSIEILLLQNQSEPIQSNVGLRLAFLTETEPQKRKNVKDIINRAYKFRSSYIHHGKIKEDWELLQNIQHLIWTAIRNALVYSNRYKSTKEFFDYIEHLILS